jgi:RNA polymerase sigma-70 factor, ECF subfamily
MMMVENYLMYLADMDSFTLDNLMEQYGQDVWNYAYFITKNLNLTDDITQDVFLQAYRHVSTFRGESSVKTWLLKITRNISYNYLHSAFFRKVLLVDLISPPKEYGDSAEKVFLEKETANEIWKKIFKLPTKYREVIVLQAKYELSLSEISSILKIPEGTVKSRLFGARKRMSILLKEELINETI